MMVGMLVGRRILVVEDEYFIAFDMKRAFLAEGAIVIGPVGQLDLGLALVNHEKIDAAVLDVNLGKATTYQIADLLAEAAIPWVFVTGYDEWAMAAKYRDTPRLAKPFTMNDVVHTVIELLAGTAVA